MEPIDKKDPCYCRLCCWPHKRKEKIVNDKIRKIMVDELDRKELQKRPERILSMPNLKEKGEKNATKEIGIKESDK